MEDLICPKCGLINGEYYTELKAKNNVARCIKCDTFIKNIPQGGEPTLYFGKYKGNKISDIEDIKYLNWVLENVKVTKPIKDAISKQIIRFENLAR